MRWWRGQLRLEAEKRAKRLHVSNLPEGFTESKVTEFLNSAMKAAASGLVSATCLARGWPGARAQKVAPNSVSCRVV